MMWLGGSRTVSGSQCLQTALPPSTALWPSAGPTTPAGDPGLLNLKHNSGRVWLLRGHFLCLEILLFTLSSVTVFRFCGKCEAWCFEFLSSEGQVVVGLWENWALSSRENEIRQQIKITGNTNHLLSLPRKIPHFTKFVYNFSYNPWGGR